MSIRIVKSNQNVIQLGLNNEKDKVVEQKNKLKVIYGCDKVIQLSNNKQSTKIIKLEIKMKEQEQQQQQITGPIILNKNCKPIEMEDNLLDKRKANNQLINLQPKVELKVPKIELIVPKIEFPESQSTNQIVTQQNVNIIIPKKDDSQSNLLKNQLFYIKKNVEPVSLLLQPNDMRKKYYSRTQKEKEDIIHWGQRKLLISEIWFLTQYGFLSNNIIYAGAAPGFHIPLLAELFSNHKFFLYDPHEFQIIETSRIKIYQKLFTELEAQKLKEQLQNDYLFISDIRTANYKQMNPKENEEAILQDNLLQMQWTQILKPLKSMLKFRCVYPTEIQEPTEFFQGDIYIQAWAPASSTETRLVPNNYHTTIKYDNLKYEEQLFYHNDVLRKQQKGVLSWDERAETQILTSYILSLGIEEHYIQKEVNKLRNKITSKLFHLLNY